MEIAGTIGDILQKKGSTVYTIGADALVYDAIKLMGEKNIGALLVKDGDKLVGVMSERDYARKVALQGKYARTTPVRDILTSVVVSVTPHSSVEEAMQAMTNHRVRHLPVLDGENVVGIVSIGDIVNWIIITQHHTIHQLKSYIAGEYS
jgi:CBS domain-containing protein